MKSFSNRASTQRATPEPNEHGMVHKSLTLTVKADLLDFFDKETERQHRSFASIVVERLEKYRESLQKIRE